MAWDLQKIKDELENFVKTRYPGLGIIFILTGESTPVITQDKKEIYALDLIQGSNLAPGPTAAVLAECLRGRIQNIVAVEKFLKDQPESGGNA